MVSDLISTISARFKSGNSVPVERSHITVDEWAQIRQAIADHEAEQDQQAKDAARWHEVIKGNALVVECLNRNGKPVIVSIADRAECVNWREAYTTAIDAALSTTKQEEV